MIHSADHWENVYRNKNFDAVSWYAPHLGESLRLIEQLCPDKTSAIVDVGAKAQQVNWHVGRAYGDITRYNFGEEKFDLWHDRAVFHFLTDPAVGSPYPHGYVSAILVLLVPCQ